MADRLTEARPPGHVEDVVLAPQIPAPTAAPTAPAPPPADSLFTAVAKTVSFREIYDEHFAFVYRSARRLGVHERALDDAAQDVFLVVYRRLAEFEGRSSIKTWLYGITRRVAKDHRRRAARKDHGQVPPDDLATTEQSPAEDAARREAAERLEAILEALDPAKREVFVLAEIEQMTVPEIAEALAINLNTTYSRLRVARAEFEKAVARHLAAAELRS